ncbi:transmembrane protein 170A [Austrofundulus limnaeus]|uniref:Transmembrane protein 170A n=1 Tax=Austrofundulus limnaeus TaxID=52670 RepID=A0A2I4BDB7_AUSLI|nr:PREDICTED: transmembrane protein 170A [Austrofundulus limnaeus]
MKRRRRRNKNKRRRNKTKRRRLHELTTFMQSLGSVREMQDNEISFVQQVLSLNLLPRHNVTSLSDFSGMWCGVFLWTAVSSLIFHLPAALLSLAALRQHKIARLMSIAIILMGVLGPLFGGVLTSAAIAGVYKAAAKTMSPLEAFVFGVGQSFCVVFISFVRILATL